MNPLNYGSREACQRLVDAGIVLETEFVWYEFWNGTEQYYSLSINNIPGHPHIPAVSMAEAWRELPEQHEGCQLTLMKNYHKEYQNIAGYLGEVEWNINRFNTNTTDALIYLLIWVRTKGAKS